MNDSVWGDRETQYFFQLSPERVLDAVESTGIRTTGRALPLNSMENRVFDVELELVEGAAIRSPSDKQRVVKFYRPGRWSPEQIQEEHDFLLELAAEEIPVIAPLHFADGATLRRDLRSGIYYAIFPKRGGRAPDELSIEQLTRIGRLLARLHLVGIRRPALHRCQLTPHTYGAMNLDYLQDEQLIPLELENRYGDCVTEICETSAPWFDSTPVQRIHGDCHMGNILWHPDNGPLLLDFDDMVMGPCVQDFWLLISGRDEAAKIEWETLLSAYESLCNFNRNSLRLVEPLRALRIVHFSAWIGKRWQDPAFQQAFPQYGSHPYWQAELAALEEIRDLVRELGKKAYFEVF